GVRSTRRVAGRTPGPVHRIDRRWIVPVTSRWHPSFGTAEATTPGGAARHVSTSRGSWALSAVGLIVVGLLAWWVTHSAIFDARRISVDGNRRLSAARVLRIGGVSEG